MQDVPLRLICQPETWTLLTLAPCPGFIDDERAEHIVKIADARLAPSGLALRRGDTMASQR